MEKISAKQNENSFPIYPENKHLCTEKLYYFLRRHFSIFDLLFFNIDLARNADRVRLVAATALAKTGEDKHAKALEEAEKNKDAMFKKLQSFSVLQSENLCIRLADNLLCYISEIIQACMLKRPELLRSGEMIAIEDVLKFSSYAELTAFLVDRKLNELTYGGIKGISAFLTERTGFDLFSNENERALLTLSIELRNIYTHNRGVVNELFLKRTSTARSLFPAWRFKQGERFHAGFTSTTVLANNMYRIASKIDAQAATKFKIKKKTYGKWDQERKKRIEAAEEIEDDGQFT
jgi:hypothetical protein